MLSGCCHLLCWHLNVCKCLHFPEYIIEFGLHNVWCPKGRRTGAVAGLCRWCWWSWLVVSPASHLVAPMLALSLCTLCWQELPAAARFLNLKKNKPVASSGKQVLLKGYIRFHLIYIWCQFGVCIKFDLTECGMIFQVFLCQCSCYVAEDQQYQWLEKVRKKQRWVRIGYSRARCLYT